MPNKPKRKYKRKTYKRTYTSKRVKEKSLKGNPSKQRTSKGKVYVTLSVLLTSIIGLNNTNYLKSFLSTL
jgi:hypothetical protein